VFSDHDQQTSGDMGMWRKLTFAAFLGAAAWLAGGGSASAQSKLEGEMRFAVYATITPAWLDAGDLTPFFMYALHDALV
jgi:hypothetical protein